MARNQHRPQLIRRVTMGNMTALPSGKTTLGKQMRALSDSLDLAETSGINTSRVILWTWIFAAGLAVFGF